MSEFIGEFLGTFVLILLGNGVVAGALLEHSKAKNGGWIVITAGWAFAVIFGIFVAKTFGSPGAHLNPAVTLSVAIQSGNFENLIPFAVAQISGAFLGSVFVYLHYLPHWKKTTDQSAILAIFSTEPAISHSFSNFISEALGAAVLILGIHSIFSEANSGLTPAFGAFLVGILVWAIGLSMGGTTGYAINPARDFGPRLAHWILPITNKGKSGWKYAWIPIIAPFTGAGIAALLLRWFG
ncbi:MIP/aquaporin family protein [Leptospira ilyithenensis]|uniref:Aquaporin family protein n=1 Tax=Leptospira ilyithenensis TaxID=2484901 RepID=A0A4R9LPQ2_9LEPT|nr:MIP/aquaporin family protein [Leptospira ilyithenensis]TGN11065.1 aquaporin family protein [Leptospira ilyithenensis]